MSRRTRPPHDPAKGLVWTAITDHVDTPGHSDGWITITDLDRHVLAKHPWSLTCGGAVDLIQQIEAAKAMKFEDHGVEIAAQRTGSDEASPLGGAGRTTSGYWFRPGTSRDLTFTNEAGCYVRAPYLYLFWLGDNMHELLDEAAGEWMELAAYRADFRAHFWNVDQVGFWKLERQQFFQEPEDASWAAFAEGEWEEALRLLEDNRADLEDEHRRIAQHGFAVNRVRVVEEPIIPYLQWELHLLRVREECGSRVRVVGPEQVAQYEATEPLPEIVTLGTAVMYEVIYDERGILDGGRRYTHPELITRWQRLIADLYAAGEPLSEFFTRRVANMPAPDTSSVPPRTRERPIGVDSPPGRS